jgi:hypothetical protein
MGTFIPKARNKQNHKSSCLLFEKSIKDIMLIFEDPVCKNIIKKDININTEPKKV